ncbi:hypothetical protein EOD42_16550 [Rhodovarius crocodyli]|uniref:Uncharacterized protein n=1 Tax=Rhodovarius crocodyli TaxID=1979269 RepID=A0A437MDU1_9PROT|nr:hypothetical protein [Rhodovarius crocodyli]RVT95798.1 hypothetical protein EOD42_16550 [Rhodovarius crocodyli]
MIAEMTPGNAMNALIHRMRRYLATLLGGAAPADRVLVDLLKSEPHRFQNLSTLEALRLAHAHAGGAEQPLGLKDPLRRALMEAPFNRRAAFILTHLEGLDAAEAGWVLGMPGTVASRQAQAALEQMKATLFPGSLLAVVVDHDTLNARRVCRSLELISVETRRVPSPLDITDEDACRPVLLITEAIDINGDSRGPETACSAGTAGQPVLCITDAGRFEAFRRHVPKARLLAKPFGALALRECVMDMMSAAEASARLH